MERGRTVRLLSRRYLLGSKHCESNAPFLLLASEYGLTSRKDAMTCFLWAMRSSVRISSQRNPFNSGMDHVRALKGQGLMITRFY